MNEPLLLIDKNKTKGVTYLTLNRPQIHNAFNDELIQLLINAFEDLKKCSQTRVVVLTGAGKSFCAGADLNWMKKMVDYSHEENRQDSFLLVDLFNSINLFPRPVIALQNGAALGGGAGLLACCDYVLAQENAKIGFTEVRLGLVPAVISPFVIAKIGESQARASFLHGAIFKAPRALNMGLVHEVCAIADWQKRSEELITEFLAVGPNAQKEAKALIAGVMTRLPQGINEQMNDFTVGTIAKMRVSAEGQEGMKALLEKRPAEWQV